jgi:hypothetical protein
VTVSELSHIINLIIGDNSRDGHEKTETITISCNLTKAQLEKAYTAGAKKLGFDLSVDVARKYKDSSISEDFVKKLRAVGIDPTEFLEQDDGGWSFGYPSTSFIELWLRIATLGDPSLVFEYMVKTRSDIFVGGYGLFT